MIVSGDAADMSDSVIPAPSNAALAGLRIRGLGGTFWLARIVFNV
jgi:hypothetical protein